MVKELNISERNLYSWRAKFRKENEYAFSNKPQEDAQTLELRRLSAENARLKEEREILKKRWRGLLRKVIYGMIKYQSAFCSIEILCEVLGVSRN